MTTGERARKAVMLNLVSLDRGWYADLVGVDPMDVFPEELEAFSESGLCVIEPNRLALTPKGLKYRDLLAQSLFSAEVQARVSGFDYDE